MQFFLQQQYPQSFYHLIFHSVNNIDYNPKGVA